MSEFPLQSGAGREESREWERLKAEVEPLLISGHGGLWEYGTRPVYQNHLNDQVDSDQ